MGTWMGHVDLVSSYQDGGGGALGGGVPGGGRGNGEGGLQYTAQVQLSTIYGINSYPACSCRIQAPRLWHALLTLQHC
jgi:hypothetical protein